MLCGGCALDLPRAQFSNSQLKKTGPKKCRECTAGEDCSDALRDAHREIEELTRRLAAIGGAGQEAHTIHEEASGVKWNVLEHASSTPLMNAVLQGNVDRVTDVLEKQCGRSRDSQCPTTGPECSVCLEAYREPPSDLEPVSLHCGHSLCRRCASQLPIARKKKKAAIDCPTCREPSALPKGDTAALPCNYALTEAIRMSRASDAMRSKPRFASVDEQRADGATALLLAVRTQRLDVVRTLLRFHADPTIGAHGWRWDVRGEMTCRKTRLEQANLRKLQFASPLMVAVMTPMAGVWIYYDNYSGHAEGERRGLDRMAG